MLKLIDSGRLDLDPVVGDRVPLTEIRGFDQLESAENPKAIIDMIK